MPNENRGSLGVEPPDSARITATSDQSNLMTDDDLPACQCEGGCEKEAWPVGEPLCRECRQSGCVPHGRSGEDRG